MRGFDPIMTAILSYCDVVRPCVLTSGYCDDSCRQAVVQKYEGGLQPPAQAGNQTGATRQTWRPGEWKHLRG